jgi:uncharacterized protein YodC (DUF2158 family)
MVMAVSTPVTIKYTVFTGVVTGGLIDDAGTYQIKVKWTDQNGMEQERYFTEDQLQT